MGLQHQMMGNPFLLAGAGGMNNMNPMAAAMQQMQMGMNMGMAGMFVPAGSMQFHPGMAQQQQHQQAPIRPLFPSAAATAAASSNSSAANAVSQAIKK